MLIAMCPRQSMGEAVVKEIFVWKPGEGVVVGLQAD